MDFFGALLSEKALNRTSTEQVTNTDYNVLHTVEEQQQPVAVTSAPEEQPEDYETDSSVKSHSGADGNSLSCYQRVVSIFVRYLPVHEYGTQFHLFALSACCLYGAMVPFWFVGSKFIQINYGMSVGRADALMLLPEGVIVVVSPLSGYLMDTYRLSLRTKLSLLALACVSLAVCYLLLAFGYGSVATVPPLLTMSLLGLSYAFSNSLLWTAIVLVIPDRHLASASGVVASAMNVLPSVVPHVILYLEWLLVIRHHSDTVPGSSNVGMFALTGVALLSALFAYLSSVAVNHTEWSVESPSSYPPSSLPDLHISIDSTPPPKSLRLMSDFEARSRQARSPLSRLSTSAVSIGEDDDDEQENEDYSDYDGGEEEEFEGVQMTALDTRFEGVTSGASGAKRHPHQQARKSPTGRRGVDYSSVETGDYDE
eukprot:gene25598-32070_t